MSKDITYKDYQEKVKSLAKSTIDTYNQYKEDYGNTSEVLWEVLDSEQWIIYNGYHLDIIEQSETSLSNLDWQIYVDDFDEASHLDIFMAMAYSLLQADVRRKINEIKEDQGG